MNTPRITTVLALALALCACETEGPLKKLDADRRDNHPLKVSRGPDRTEPIGFDTPEQDAATAARTGAPALIQSDLPGVQPIMVESIKAGRGERASAGQTVMFHYTGTFLDGEKFDSSRDRDAPFGFVLGAGRVIKGWDLVAARMRVGDRWRVTIPPELAYGDRGAGPIAGGTTLVFDMEFLKIK